MEQILESLNLGTLCGRFEAQRIEPQAVLNLMGNFEKFWEKSLKKNLGKKFEKNLGKNFEKKNSEKKFETNFFFKIFPEFFFKIFSWKIHELFMNY